MRGLLVLLQAPAVALLLLVQLTMPLIDDGTTRDADDALLALARRRVGGLLPVALTGCWRRCRRLLQAAR